MSNEKNQTANNINKYIKEICRLLELGNVKISNGTEKFHLEIFEEKPMSIYIPEEDTLYVERLTEPTPKLLYYIAYGLRHAWQKKYYPVIFYTTYKKRTEENSLERFLLQSAEIDAHAFADIIMRSYFRLLYNAFDGNLQKKILKKEEELLSNGLTTIS